MPEPFAPRAEGVGIAMTPFGTDLMTELRRPFRTRGPMGRRAMGGTALVCLATVGVLAVLGSLLGEPIAPGAWLLAPLTNNMSSSFDTFRAPVLLAMAQVGGVGLWLCAGALVPLAFAMVRRAHSTGLPRVLAILLVLVAVVSSLAVILAADERIGFPLTRGLWAFATQDVPGANEQLVGLAIVFSPFLLVTFIFDILLIVFVGLLAFGAAALSLGSCLVLCCVPTRKDLFP